MRRMRSFAPADKRQHERELELRRIKYKWKKTGGISDHDYKHYIALRRRLGLVVRDRDVKIK